MHPSLLASYDALERRSRALLSQLGTYTPEQLAYRPAAGSWCLLEVADHLLRTESAVVYALGKGLPAHKRRPTWRQRLARPLVVPALRWPIRIKVPTEHVQPRAGRTLDEVRAEWQQVRAALAARLGAFDAASLREPVVLHPIGGPVNAAQTLAFLGAHVDHHGHQVRRIRTHPGFPAAAA